MVIEGITEMPERRNITGKHEPSGRHMNILIFKAIMIMSHIIKWQ